jgi:cytidylate kinase
VTEPATPDSQHPGEGLDRVVIAIDGPSGSGKSTVARSVAERLGLRYLDTGAMYRAVTARVLAAEVDPGDADAVVTIAESVQLEPRTDPARPGIRVDGEDLTAAVRGPEVTATVSAVSALPAVRARLVAVQRAVIGDGGIVVEGRDIGTTVAPDAAVKIFLTADAAARAHRRTLETRSTVDDTSLASTERDLRRRDELDSSRAASPLTQAADAVAIDTTDLPVGEVVDRIIALASVAVGGPADRPAEPGVVRRPSGPVDVGPLVRSQAAPKALAMRIARLIGRVLFPLVFRLRVLGRDRMPARGPVIMAGNHTGFLDGPAVFATARRRAYFFIKAELYGGPQDRWLDWLGQIPINRGRPDRTALGRGLDVLSRGEVLGMFPEGTRGSGDLETVQHGIAYLALRANCPVVPVACFGTLEALPKDSRFPRWRAPVDVVYGEPFHVEVEADPRTRRAVAQAAEEIRSRLVAHLAAAGEQTGRAPARPGS